MYELKDDPVYGVIRNYPARAVDWCVMKDDAPYRGEPSHREALRFAMQCVSLPDGEDEPIWEYDLAKAAAKEIDAKTLLSLPDAPLSEQKTRKDGSVVTHYRKRADGGALSYAEAFLLPPCGVEYAAEDFRKINDALFPHGEARLTVYEWTADWSDYFDDGREWWGTACFSVYDAAMDRYVVILASATD